MELLSCICTMLVHYGTLWDINLKKLYNFIMNCNKKSLLYFCRNKIIKMVKRPVDYNEICRNKSKPRKCHLQKEMENNNYGLSNKWLQIINFVSS